MTRTRLQRHLNTDPHDELGALRAELARLAAELEAARAHAARLEALAHEDPLTGVCNRRGFLRDLGRALAYRARYGTSIALILVDVDRFKGINDAHGHAAGDRVLQGVAGRLTSALREMDTVARLGGDEFVVIATDVHRPDDVLAVAEKLRTAMHPPLLVDGCEVPVTLSLGVGLYPDDATDADGLLRRSDAALYRAKEAGRDTVRMA